MSRCGKCLWKIFLILLVTTLLYLTLKQAAAIRVAMDNHQHCQTAVCHVQPNDALPPPSPEINNLFNKDTAMFLIDGILRIHSGVLPPHPALKQMAMLTVKSKKLPECVVYQMQNQPQTLVILLRGTKTLNDLLTDLRISQHLYGSPLKDVLQLFTMHEITHWTIDSLDRLKMDKGLKQTFAGNMQIHRGFFNMYNELREQLWSILNQLKPTHVYIGGHSLGGAVGNLMALDIGVNLPTLLDLRLYTFGAPKVGNSDFVRNCRKIPKWTQFFQLENTADIIPTLPLPVTPNMSGISPPFLYDKSGQSLYYSANWGSVVLNHSLDNYSLALMNL